MTEIQADHPRSHPGGALLVSIPPPIKWLLAVDMLLGLAYLAMTELNRIRQFHFISDLVDLDKEANIPTWFASMQLMLVALVLSVLAWSLLRDRRAGLESAWPLLPAIALVLALSIDETAGFHEWFGHKIEQVAPALERHQHWFSRSGVWMLFLIPPFLLAAWFAARAAWPLLRGRPQAQRLLLTGLTVLILSAGGSELLNNHLQEGSRAFVLNIFIEEVGELLGGTLLLWGSYELARSHGLRLVREKQ